MKSRALLVTDLNRIEVGEIEIPSPGENEVLIETAFSCISPGTELRCLRGQQAGCPGFPYVPGYSMAGIVREAGPCSLYQPGDRVFCSGTARADQSLMWGGHCQYAVRDTGSVFGIPENVDLAHAAIAKLAAISQRGVNIAGATVGDTVAVVGLGAIGQLSARLHAQTGARVCGADLSKPRVERLRHSGIEALVLEKGSLQDAFVEKFPDGVDVVVDATGQPAVLEQTLQVARIKDWNDPAPGPRLVIQGSYPGAFTLPYEEAFRREVRILLPRDQTPQELGQVLRSMAQGTLVVADLVKHVIPPEDCQDIYDALQGAPGELLTALFKWS